MLPGDDRPGRGGGVEASVVVVVDGLFPVGAGAVQVAAGLTGHCCPSRSGHRQTGVAGGTFQQRGSILGGNENSVVTQGVDDSARVIGDGVQDVAPREFLGQFGDRAPTLHGGAQAERPGGPACPEGPW